MVDTPDLSVEEDRSTTSSLNKIETKTDDVSKTGASTLRKATRQSDVSLSDEQSTGSLNDILTGLLNVVGEGLSIASNYVKENQKKKESEVMKYDSTLDMSNVNYLKLSDTKRNRCNTWFYFTEFKCI